MSTTLTEPEPVVVDEKYERYLRDIRAKTLHWVNEELVKMGKPPIEDLPKGHPGSEYNCPIATALGGAVSAGLWWPDGDDEDFNVLMPSCATNFTIDFDFLGYPDLIA